MIVKLATYSEISQSQQNTLEIVHHVANFQIFRYVLKVYNRILTTLSVKDKTENIQKYEIVCTKPTRAVTKFTMEKQEK